MANVIYSIILFIFIFGATVSYINDTGLYTIKLAESGAQSDIGQAQQLNTALTETSKSPSMSVTDQLYIIATSITGGLLAVFTLGPLLHSLGIPLGMIGMLISPLGIVAAFWVIELWTGRSQE
jgi:F0F1-type ATP synthase assembly protein I